MSEVCLLWLYIYIYLYFQLNDLRRKQLSVFIVATNRLRSFDAAVTRPGRFDMLLFVGTPNLQGRMYRLKQKLASLSGISDTKKDDIAMMVQSYLTLHWHELRFLTFAENESFLTTIINFVVSKMYELLLYLLSTITILQHHHINDDVDDDNDD